MGWIGGRKAMVMTVGHGRRAMSEFMGLLFGHDIDLVMDIRGVGHLPEFGEYQRERLVEALGRARIEYRDMPGLAVIHEGKGEAGPRVPHRLMLAAFAEYMATETFARELDDIEAVSRHRRIALMCEEIAPWRCHRALIADALTARGLTVRHILTGVRFQTHKSGSWAEPEVGMPGRLIETRGDTQTIGPH